MVRHLSIAEKKEWQLESSQNKAFLIYGIDTRCYYCERILNHCLRIDGESIDRNQPILLSLWRE
jgi:hypothetical protein